MMHFTKLPLPLQRASESFLFSTILRRVPCGHSEHFGFLVGVSKEGHSPLTAWIHAISVSSPFEPQPVSEFVSSYFLMS